MATRKKGPPKKAVKKKAARKKKPPVLNLKKCPPMPGPHVACEPVRRVYMEGEPWPNWLIDQYRQRLDAAMKNYREHLAEVNAPAKDIKGAVTGMFKAMHGINKGDRNATVAQFVKEYQDLKRRMHNVAIQAKNLAFEMYEGSLADMEQVNAIAAGNFAVVLPTQTMTNNGEALVSKPPAGSADFEKSKD